LPVIVGVGEELLRALHVVANDNSMPSVLVMCIYGAIVVAAAQPVLRFKCPRCAGRYYGNGNIIASCCQQCGYVLRRH